ncbi:hypothetical protein [Lysinibacillus pakistanensis]|uniref:Uncharacterized protein n=1 Tax=Lysinibacillus pakistanensis TaxID=759811 RepID=A0AAX3X190_9BACI|nr:hypothetical protein [Lysinibacillus pakistanensis]MDM5233510.1 hypothetical protein [Lysinibacillus pakistanensis]WHY48982.1 hypothetical protein QNH22_12385 [Lysinibacillus pakistanensis]WHY53993.1 hypothetical protein QNH24_12365 [Lysinibacillus pakistanensis]
MGRFLTIEELRERIKQLDEEKEARDIEQGYCILQQPSYKPVVSDVWAEEAYYKYLPEINIFLEEYASLLLEVKEVFTGDSPKLLEWQALLDIASECKDSSLRFKCLFISKVFLKAAIEGKSQLDYAKLAEMIANSINDYPYHVYYKERYDDGYGEDKQGTFYEYYAMKREELAEWLREH